MLSCFESGTEVVNWATWTSTAPMVRFDGSVGKVNSRDCRANSWGHRSRMSRPKSVTVQTRGDLLFVRPFLEGQPNTEFPPQTVFVPNRGLKPRFHGGQVGVKRAMSSATVRVGMFGSITPTRCRIVIPTKIASPCKNPLLCRHRHQQRNHSKERRKCPNPIVSYWGLIPAAKARRAKKANLAGAYAAKSTAC